MSHYETDPDLIQSSLPDDLLVDTYEGGAWFSVVAFRLTNLSIRPLTFLTWNDFWEINLRTYVCDQEGNKGVWFYSLDSSDLWGVWGARLLYGLRYNFAQIRETAGRLRLPGSRQIGMKPKVHKALPVHWINFFWNATGFG